jgi:prevent-host-death family protein
MKTVEIGAFEAKTRFAELLEKVQRGQVFCITMKGKPVAELRTADQVGVECEHGPARSLTERFAALRSKVKPGSTARELIAVGRRR